LEIVFSKGFPADFDNKLAIPLLNVDAALLRELSHRGYTPNVQQQGNGRNGSSGS
jgi:hypothetical protein